MTKRRNMDPIVIEPSRFRKKVKSLNLSPLIIIISGFLIIGGLLVFSFSINGVKDIVNPPKVISFSPVDAPGGYVKDPDSHIRMSLIRFEQAILRAGVTTTVVAIDGNVISATLASNGDIDMTSQDTNPLQHYIRVLGVQYYRINPIRDANTSLLDSPSQETWTTDMSAVQTKVDEYLNIINPASLLASLTPYTKILSAHTKADGSMIVAIEGVLSDIPADKAILYGFPTVADKTSIVRIYATLSSTDDLTRLMIVLPDESSLLISVEGQALKTVTKPDLTRVVFSLNLPMASPSPSAPVEVKP